MSQIQIFNYTCEDKFTKEVNTILIDDVPYWLAKDICDILELTDVSKTLERLDGDEKLLRKFFVSGQNRDMWLVNESGLYSLNCRL